MDRCGEYPKAAHAEYFALADSQGSDAYYENMLRIRQNTHSIGAKNYYSSADYYSEGQELTGRWRGKAADKLGLAGEVNKEQWDALCDNRHPDSGERLTLRTKKDRTVGYDFNFHVPKSVSLLYAMTRDERLLDAFRDSVDATMRDMESEMATRVRKGGRNENRLTGNLVWGEFIHFTSRPVGGVPDPHLHAHCFVFNTTYDDKEQAWKAGQFRELKRDAPYFEAMFHSRFAERLADLGLPVERHAKGWELAGLDKPLIDKFSRRTAQIEAKAKERGITNVDAKAELGAKTRERKQKHLSFPELQEHWQGRMTPTERDSLDALEQKIGSDAAPPDENASARAIEHALGHCFERASVVPERQVLASALRHSVGRASVEQVHHAAAGSELVVGNRHGRRMATTHHVLKEERRMIRFAREGRGTCRSLGSKDRKLKREWLDDDQRMAVEHILSSHDQVILVRGGAGVGKTSLMQEAVEAIEEHGTKVFPFAPSAAASRGVQRADGFDEADTVARLLLDRDVQRRAVGQALWIDEAGLLSVKTMAKIFDLANELGARVLLTGDRRQHGSVERGAALRLLEEEAGLVPANVKEIKRQAGDYKAAVHALSEGRVTEGFDRLDKLGWVRELPHSERHRQLAADYLEAVAEGKTALVVSPTHAEAARITSEIRTALRESGAIGSDERTFTVLHDARLTEAERGDAVNYAAGDVLQFHQNAKGFKRGDRVVVDNPESLPLDQAERFQLFHKGEMRFAPGDIVRITHNGRTADGKHRLENGTVYRVKQFDEAGNIVLANGWRIDREFAHLAHGYVVTSHASQGRTVDCVFVGQSSESFPASSREQFYVSASRAREQVVVYTDDKVALREAIARSEDRVSATEFVDMAIRLGILQKQQEQDRQPREPRELERAGYERE